MTSLVYITDNKTFYIIYILHPPDLTEKSKELLNSVEENYFEGVQLYILIWKINTKIYF